MHELPEQIRAFVAVRIPSACLDALARCQNDLKRRLRDVSWTRPEAMHLTLLFLGNVPSAEIPAITALLGGTATQFPAIHLKASGLGSFGNRVLWAGVQGDTAVLSSLATRIRHELARFASHEEDRDYNAHITLGRMRNRSPGVGAALRAAGNPEFGSWTAHEVELIRSELSPHGARYTTLAAAPFTAP